MYEQLKESVWRANMRLVEAGLVVLTWGNASGVDRAAGVMAIKPSGVDYAKLRPEHIVVLNLESGQPVEEHLRASSDTPTHLELYRAFPEIGGVIHTHSSCATSWAQAGCEIPCYGTTHADHFYGCIPVTRQLSASEIEDAYELNTGRVIIDYFTQSGRKPGEVPGALVPCHGPFAWGKDVDKAVQHAIIIEEVAKMAFQTCMINPQTGPIPQCLADKHYLRKHGPGAYYGQKE